jgi:hypothetical protein
LTNEVQFAVSGSFNFNEHARSLDKPEPFAVTMIIAMGDARAEMSVDARKTAYFVGKAASQLPLGYMTEEFLRKLAVATRCDTPLLVGDFIKTERDEEQYFRTHKK